MEILGHLWDTIWQTLLNILVAIDSVVGVPAVAIIIFTILIRLLTVPLTMKSLRSNRNMQQVQPLIKEVQKKYKDDRAKQQEETMKLYHQYGINPAAGCFPMLVQLPVFFALYTALRYTLNNPNPAELSHILWNSDWVKDALSFGKSGFLWVSSLGAADPLFIWPVLSGIFQFFQNRMSMPIRDPNQPVDSQQRMMNGIMQFMPLYIVLISFGFPVGNVIYWAFSSLFGAVQQYFITGFGSLPNFPGFGWLPRKEVVKPKPLMPLPEGQVQPRGKGIMGKMMERALQAQEEQRANQPQTKSETGTSQASQSQSQPTKPATTNATRPPRPSDGATTARVGRSKASEQHIKIVQPVDTVKYASDLRHRQNGAPNGNGNGNGYSNDYSPTALPRKKRNKK